MNLTTMATYVCGKLRLTDTTALARCKTYIAQRYEMIYADQLWKDSLFAFDFVWNYDGTSTYGYSPGNSQTLTQAGYFLLPTSVDRLVALRTADRGLSCRPFEFYFRNDYDVFLNEGTPFDFVILPPVVAMTDPNSVVSPTITISAPESTNGTGVTFQIEYSDYYGNQHDISLLVNSANATSITPTDELTTLMGTMSELISITKPVTGGSVTIAGIESGAAGLGYQQMYMLGVQTTLPKRLRIRMAERPKENTDMRALVKRKCQPLTSDYDEPALRGVTNCLIAFAQADMLQFDHQYGKSQALAQEALALLEQLKKQAIVQELNSVQVTPVTEAVNDVFGFPSKSDFI